MGFVDLVDARVEFCPEYSRDKFDACFYVTDGPQWVATVYLNNRMLDVIRYGEMEIRLPDDHRPIKYSEHLETIGIDTDLKLQEMSDKYRIHDIWVMNPWFELVTPDLENLDAAFISLDDAVNEAYTLLNDEKFLEIHPCVNPDYKYKTEVEINEIQ